MLRLILPALAFALLPALAAAQQAPPALRCKAAPVPPGSRVTLIAPRVATDGLPMAIVEASSALSQDALLQFYTRAWTAPGGRPVYLRYRVGPWSVIAHAEAGCFYTVQTQARGQGSVALLGVSEPARGSAEAMRLAVAAPGDARVLTHMVSRDGGKLGDTWLLYSAQSPAEVLRFYARALPAQGWSRTMLRPVPGADQRSVGMYQKGASAMGIVVQPMRAGSSITLTVESH
ncbi:MAG: hypothetical protein KGI40_10635 [Xanthomonadaceae bacterium]|nr:hypothetical protein [Xanthomonadaceae bacterium]MDE1959522.1 hypothetical protein [Xanthomonadaceae bacterium]MDE2178165.1 hypothetical protein [Xanthomonadaceae bacterium]MDE2246472.1 hypothetical protein [Xanthomonadaceae bacterium]